MNAAHQVYVLYYLSCLQHMSYLKSLCLKQQNQSYVNTVFFLRACKTMLLFPVKEYKCM